MHKHKQFRTLRHVVLSNLCADVNFGWCFFFLVQCVLLKRFTITIRERKENSVFFFLFGLRATAVGKNSSFFFLSKNGPVTALRMEAQEHLGDSGHSYHG